MSETFEARVLAVAREQHLFDSADKVLVAVSGGPDSVALIDFLVLKSDVLGIEPIVGHVHHGTGPEADAAARNVEHLATSYGLQFLSRSVGLGADWTETGAREARYAALEAMRVECGADLIASGHHRDDQVETVLLRFLKGSGPAGLAGMQYTAQRIVRPLLGLARCEIEEWVSSRNIGRFVAYDSSNEDVKHDRNWVRLELMPLLRERFGEGADECILRVANHADLFRRAWRESLRDPQLELRSGEGWIEVARAPLQRYDKTLSEALLQALSRELGVVLGRRQSILVRRFVAGGTSGHSLDVGSGWQFDLIFDRLRLCRGSAQEAPGALVLDVAGTNGEVATWAGWSFDWREDVAGRAERTSHTTWVPPGVLTVRALEEGDRMAPLRGAGRRPVRRLLMDARVPRHERLKYPVIEMDGVVVWVPGVCRSNVELPEEGTKAIRIDVAKI